MIKRNKESRPRGICLIEKVDWPDKIPNTKSQISKKSQCTKFEKSNDICAGEGFGH
jgi:hypothetical protein